MVSEGPPRVLEELPRAQTAVQKATEWKEPLVET